LLFLALINGLLLLVLIKKDLTGLVGLVVAILPFSDAIGNIEIGIITFYSFTLGILLLNIIAIPKIFRTLLLGKVSPTDKWLLMLSLSYLISTLSANNVVESGHLAFNAIFVPILTYIAMHYLVRNEQEWQKVFVMFLISIILFSVVVTAEFIVVQKRVSVLNMQYISAATLFAVPLVSLISLKLWRRWYWLVGYILLLAGFFATLSRMYMVVLLFTPFIYVGIRKGFSLHILVIFLASTLSLTLLLASAPELVKHEQYFKEENNTIDRVINIENWKRSLFVRASVFREGLNIFADHPLIGVGLRKGELMITQHNFNVEWLEYGGILGYLLYAGAFITLFRRARVLARSDRYIATNLTLVIVILANSSTNGLMHGVMPIVIMLLMGLTEARIAWQRVAPDKTSNKIGNLVMKPTSSPSVPIA